MVEDPKRTVDEVTSDLEDLTTRVEELEIDPKVEEHAQEARRLRLALEEAVDAADILDERVDTESHTTSKRSTS